jgi:hypothetical protein
VSISTPQLKALPLPAAAAEGDYGEEGGDAHGGEAGDVGELDKWQQALLGRCAAHYLVHDRVIVARLEGRERGVTDQLCDDRRGDCGYITLPSYTQALLSTLLLSSDGVNMV